MNGVAVIETVARQMYPRWVWHVNETSTGIKVIATVHHYMSEVVPTVVSNDRESADMVADHLMRVDKTLRSELRKAATK